MLKMPLRKVRGMSEDQGGVGKQRIDPVTQYFKLVRSTSKNPPKLTRPVPKMPVPSLEKAQKQGYMGYNGACPLVRMAERSGARWPCRVSDPKLTARWSIVGGSMIWLMAG